MGGEEGAAVAESDFLLPLSHIARSMTCALPSGVKTSGETKDLMQAIATDFIGFVTCEANSICVAQGNRSITPADLISAMKRLDLGELGQIGDTWTTMQKAPPRHAIVAHQSPVP